MIMYGGVLEFDEKKHHYSFNGVPVPGVTSILQCINKPALINWASGMASDHWKANINSLVAVKNNDGPFADAVDKVHKDAKAAHRKKAETAANIGHNVHEYAECFFKTQPLPELETDQAKRGAEAFHKWMDAHNVKIKASERRVFSKQYYYAGTTDFIAEIDGVLGVGDIKTSSGIYPEMLLQTAAYQHALEEEKGIKFPVRWVVRFDKKSGDFEAKSFYKFERDFKGFVAALELHRALKEIGDDL